jgi:hypothetical protein
MEIPIEVFAILIGTALVIMTIGLAKKVGVALAVSGMFIIVLALLTDVIILGVMPETSTTVGDTTTYTLINNTFEFTEWHKIIMMLMGSMIMILGALIGWENK